MLTYLHTFVLPYIAEMFSKLGCIATMDWTDGLRFILGLQNVNGVEYAYTNFYTGAVSYLDWSTRMTIAVLNVFNELVFQGFRLVVGSVLPSFVPLWVAFLYIVVVGIIAVYILKFFIGLFT